MIQAGEDEVLLDDARRLHQQLRQMRAPSQMQIFPKMWHVFQMQASELVTALAAIDDVAEFLADSIGCEAAKNVIH